VKYGSAHVESEESSVSDLATPTAKLNVQAQVVREARAQRSISESTLNRYVQFD